MATTYALDGEIRIATRAVAKTLMVKLADIVDTILTDKRDTIILGGNVSELILIFNLRFDTEVQRDTVRDWLIARKQYSKSGNISQHTCNDSIKLPCIDHLVVDSWG